jgi:uracil-DNA glycosylase
MVSSATDISRQDAKNMLDWLIKMGADETISEQACNRFEAEVPQRNLERAAKKPAAQTVARVSKPSVAAEKMAPKLDLTVCVTLDDVIAAMASFDGCPLKKSAASFCFAGGNLASRIVILGDRPRTSEEKEGVVFGGRNVELLANMLKAIGIASPADALLMNFLPWRPPGNRPPTPQEAESCLPFVRRALELIRPAGVLSFGSLAGHWLFGADAAIPRQRGTWMGDDTVALISTFHPDDLIRSPALKKLAWADLKSFREKLVTAGALA